MAEPKINTTDDEEVAPSVVDSPVVEPAPPLVPLDPVLVWHLIKLVAALVLLPILLFKVL
ncbi:hypothetical protein [Chitinivorax sp. B]|uniref:hypothetical protein n=1 Tax=Chitinivorax sp. B TaxID=2502235 RepID=UPI0010F6D639|nr:hypothetical protein [Chitinivorax sp. B]